MGIFFFFFFVSIAGSIRRMESAASCVEKWAFRCANSGFLIAVFVEQFYGFAFLRRHSRRSYSQVSCHTGCGACGEG